MRIITSIRVPSLAEKENLATFEATHALNVVHGDVRPANILTAEEGNKV
jgi:serine/threonine protein kinase